MLTCVLGSGNPDKVKEIQTLLSAIPIKLIPQSHFNIVDAEETGSTFIENAIIKARHAAQQTGLPALADDSGIAVAALNGAPGVYSARYAGPQATNNKRIQKLLFELSQSKTPHDRRATFHCVMALMRNEKDPAPLIAQGTWDGEILLSPKGSQGFGYDPIFFVPTKGLSAAELSEEEKNKISHRGQAIHQLLQLINQHLNNNILI